MALLFNWPRQSPYLSQLRKAKQKSGSSLDKPESPGHGKPPLLTRTQSAPEFNVPRELCQTYCARMDRAALAIGVCPGCKMQLLELDSPTRVPDCKNMHHYTCPKCNSEYDVHRPGDECTCPHLQKQHHHHQHHCQHPVHRRPKSNTSPVHHAHPPTPFPSPAPTSSPSPSHGQSAAAVGATAGPQQQAQPPSRPHPLVHQHTTGHAPPAVRPAMKRRPFKKAFSIDVKDIYNMPPQPEPPSND